MEMKINNIPGVLENGLFVDLADKVLVGRIENNVPKFIPLLVVSLRILFERNWHDYIDPHS